MTVIRTPVTVQDSDRTAAGEKAADILEVDFKESGEAVEAFIQSLQEADDCGGFSYHVNAFFADGLRTDVGHDLHSFEYILHLVTEEKTPPSQALYPI